MSNIVQRSFAAGEVSPSLYGRVDQVKYATGLKTCRNFMVQRHGGVANRPGTGYVAEVKDSTKKVRLIPFIVNSSSAMVLEFGHLYMRIHKNGAQITTGADSITAATKANPCVITLTSNPYNSGTEITIYGVIGMIELNNRNFKVTALGGFQYSLQLLDGTNLNSTSYTTYTSGGTTKQVVEIVTPYIEADIPNIQYVPAPPSTYYGTTSQTMIIVHPSYAPRELKRVGADTVWTLTTITYGPTIGTPSGASAAVVGTPGTTTYSYKVAAVSATTNEESLTSGTPNVTTGNATLDKNNYVRITWNTVTGAGQYNIYKYLNSQYGFIGIAGANAFDDIGYTPNPLDTPMVDRQPFVGTGNYPSAVTYYQQRAIYANTDNDIAGVYTSRSALQKNMMVSTPIQNDDAVTFALIGPQVQEAIHMISIGKLILFTSSGEWSIEGDQSGVLTPGGINPKQYSANGISGLRPIMVNGSALYVQARGSVVRDLAFDFETAGYRGNELSIFAAHLTDKYTMSDWTYQQVPHSILWMARSDGKLLGLTYIREHMIFGWHRHDFDGTVENVCSIPQGTEDVVYLLIKRTVNGKSVRYIEYFKTRQVNAIEDSVFMDCSLSYNGTNLGSQTMTLSGGTNWTSDETLTLTSSTSYFTASEIGNAIHLTGSDGTKIRFSIKAYTSVTVVTGQVQKTVPTAMRNLAITTWARAVDKVAGLWYLEGKAVSVLGDGYVVGSPNNPSTSVLTVTNGSITLDRPYAVIHVGLPIISDLETLDIDIVGVSSIADKKKNVGRLTMFVESSRGVWAGPDVNNLTEMKVSGVTYDNPPTLTTGVVDVNIRPEWKSNGSVFIRQIDPLPLSVLTIVPSGYIG